MKKTILIGSNGGLTGVFLAKQFREGGRYHLVGTDSSTTSVGKFFVDKQYFVPDAKLGLEFVKELAKIFNAERVDYYFPTHSTEIRQVSRYADFLRSLTNTRFLVCPYETFEALEDKLIATANLSSKGVRVPKIIHNAPENLPVIMKRRFGSGGSGAQVINSKEVLSSLQANKDSVSFFEFIGGDEFTVDCLFDSEGALIGFNNRRRVKTLGGAVVITETANEVPIASDLHRIGSAWAFRGCVNFQYILKESVPYFIDINLRFPSGGLPLTVEAGLNVPVLMIDIMDGRNITPIPVIETKKRMYRYFEEIYEDF
jgi:carbamoyl-phosphate synthase large subunit